MAFIQQKMDRFAETNNHLMNQYLYISHTDALATITGTPGYFDESRFKKDVGWAGSWIFAQLSDGHHVLIVGQDGRTITVI